MPNQVHDYRTVYVAKPLGLEEPDGTHGRRQEMRRLLRVEERENYRPVCWIDSYPVGYLQ